MLAMQIAVKDGTVKLDEKLQEVRRSKGDERPLALDSNVLSDREYDIVKEADRALALLENDGSAIAFAEMFQMVRKDMLTVKGRLAQTDVGVVTVGVEDEIIKNLTDMVEALKKQRQANKDKGGKPPPPGPPKPPGEDPLVDLIAQLKLLRSMQNGLNNRTGLYAKEYRGEQRAGAELRQGLQGAGALRDDPKRDEGTRRNRGEDWQDSQGHAYREE